MRKAGANGDLTSWLKAHIIALRRGDYVALLGYIARDERHDRGAAGDADWPCARSGISRPAPNSVRASCTRPGQAYKGGPDSGVFLQITADDAKDLAVPGQKASFGVIKAAQARGDFDVLTERGRRALRVHLKGDPLKKGLAALNAALNDALN